MKSKLLALFLLTAAPMLAGGRVFFGVGFGGYYPPPVVVAPPPVYAAPYPAYVAPYAYPPVVYGGYYGYRPYGGYYRGGYGYRGYVGGGYRGVYGYRGYAGGGGYRGYRR